MSERYTELIDAAQQQQQENEARALANVRAKLEPQSHPDFDGLHCVDGGEVIPLARLQMGRVRCVTCQEVKDRGSKLFRRMT